jgi:hypothetical protein
MKPVLFLFLFLNLFISSFSQSFEEIDWQGKKVPAYTTDIYQSTEITEDAIKEKFIQMGYNPKIVKGILSYKAIKLSDIVEEPYDVLIKIDKKNKQSKDQSVVYFSMAKEYDQYVRSSSDPELLKKLRNFTQKFQEWANERALDLEIKEQESRIKNTEKKLKELTEEKENITEKIKKLEERQKDNLKELEKQQNEVESQHKALKILLEKKKS